MNATTSTRSYPSCFDSEHQYRQWHEFALKTKVGDSDYCTDCTRAYQRQMMNQCRCKFKRTRFIVDCEGYTEGRRPVSQRLVNNRKKGRR